MSSTYKKLEEKIQDHLKMILVSSGLEDSEQSLESLAVAWREKEEAFTRQIEKMDMIEVDTVVADDPSGFMALTYSGSLIGAGPQTEAGRTVLYASVGLRKDVPEKAEKTGSTIQGSVEKGNPILFAIGPVKQSSPAYRLAKVTDKMAIEDQSEKISEATLVIAEEFIDVNKTIVL